VSNLLSTVGFFGVVGLLAWLGWGLEPHWAAKDGRRFMCRMQLAPLDVHERTRWHDVKVSVDDGELFVLTRSRRAGDCAARGEWSEPWTTRQSGGESSSFATATTTLRACGYRRTAAASRC